MGQDGMFDCSGLVIYALSQVLGRSVEQWPPHLRHTRQMWDQVELNEEANMPEMYGSGGLLVMRRRWELPNGDVRLIPAHIGIVTGADETDRPTLLHAHAGEGKVIERPARTLKHVVGILPLHDLVAMASK